MKRKKVTAERKECSEDTSSELITNESEEKANAETDLTQANEDRVSDHAGVVHHG